MIKMFSRFEPLLAPDDMGGGGESGVEVQGSAEPETESGVEAQEPAEPAKSKSDASFAEMRRQLEALQKEKETWSQEKAEWEESRNEYENALGLFFEGDNKVAQAISHYEGTPLEQVVNNMETKKLIKKLEEDNKQLREKAEKESFDNQRAKDLAEIKEKFPDVDITDVMELGEEFFAYRGMGIDAVTAYSGLQMKKGTPPKSIGKVKTGTPDKSFYSKSEVEAMSSSERKKNFDKIRASMAKW